EPCKWGLKEPGIDMSIHEQPHPVSILRAAQSDYESIAELLTVSSLTIEGVREIIDNMLVIKEGGQVVGCAAFESYDDKALVRSVAVSDSARTRGYGSQLVSALIPLARSKSISELYLLTETAGGFFAKHGFSEIQRESVPESIRRSPEFATLCPSTAVVMKSVIGASPH
ncbi:MAG: arsenic resistance N-acetyltransferase ArsN2, partial [Candidatus Zixiibacteriota bacterium]